MTAKKPKRIPSFRLRKASRQGFVELDGRRHYLGVFDLPETQQRYHRFIAEWLANGRQLSVDPSDITIVELCARFWRHAQVYYRRPDGTPTSEVHNVRLALRSLNALYGSTTVAHFGPRALKAVRQQMIDQGGCRTNINRHIGRVKLMFKWAVAEELIEPSVYNGLQAVAGLKRDAPHHSAFVLAEDDARHVRSVGGRRSVGRVGWNEGSHCREVGSGEAWVAPIDRPVQHGDRHPRITERLPPKGRQPRNRSTVLRRARDGRGPGMQLSLLPFSNRPHES